MAISDETMIVKNRNEEQNNARSNIRRIERDELIEELVRSYVKQRNL